MSVGLRTIVFVVRTLSSVGLRHEPVLENIQHKMLSLVLKLDENLVLNPVKILRRQLISILQPVVKNTQDDILSLLRFTKLLGHFHVKSLINLVLHINPKAASFPWRYQTPRVALIS